MSLAARYLAIAKDPNIIPGVHHHCNEWCDYCPVTTRCLDFRCTTAFRKYHRRRESDPTFASMQEAVAFTRDISAAEGVPTPELDTLLRQSATAAELETSDPLAGIAWEYAVRVGVLMAPITEAVVTARRAQPAPRPESVILWYHQRIYFRLVRALVAKERHDAGSGGRLEDAIGSAKLVLASVTRSREALQSMDERFDRVEVSQLVALLDELERGVDERLPNARSFVRLGLDMPVG